jgi:serpin B
MKRFILVTTILLAFSEFCLISSGFPVENKDLKTIVEGNTAFALALYNQLSAAEGNFLFSPYSISTVLALAYAGARGNTEKEMAETLQFELSQEHLHPAMAELKAVLHGIAEKGEVELMVANSLWPQKDYKLLETYLAIARRYYDVSIRGVDYIRGAEDARKLINKWVEEMTNEKIKHLIQPGVLNALTRLVLVNAIYYRGDWSSPFDPKQTKAEPFFLLSGKSVSVSMMHQKRKFNYGESESLKILELPYAGGDLSMLVLLPERPDGIRDVEGRFTVENLEKWTRLLSEQMVLVFLPTFKITAQFRLDKTLISMGMHDAFNSNQANFAGIDGKTNRLFISAVVHKAFAEVNEQGTEAAASTGVAIGLTSLPPPPVTFRADHPFLFLIRENETGSILFMGRLSDPASSEE